ncbi:hypothetical protein OF83DRAFT_1089207, partial [Amylostereum chailletii]
MAPPAPSAAICDGCGTEFPHFPCGKSLCHKCQEIVSLPPNAGPLERATLQEKPQCPSCGVVYALLVNPLCGRCKSMWRDFIQAHGFLSLPEVLATIDGLVEWLVPNLNAANIQTNTAQHTAFALLEQASEFQKSASSTRLGTTPTYKSGAGQGWKETSGQIIQQKRDAKSGTTTTIKIQIIVFVNEDGKYTHEKEFAPSKVFPPSTPTRDAMVEMFHLVNNAKDNTLVWAHQTVNKYSTPEPKVFRTGTLSDLLKAFKMERWTSEAQLKGPNVVLDIRFNYLAELV